MNETMNITRLAADALIEALNITDEVLTFDITQRLDVIAACMIEARNIIGEEDDSVITAVGRPLARHLTGMIEKDIRASSHDRYMHINPSKITDDIMTVVGEYLIID